MSEKKNKVETAGGVKDDVKNAIEEEAPDRRYFAMIPKIVGRLDLSVFARVLYQEFKQTTGEGGACWKSAKTLAEACGMSEGKVSDAKKELAKQQPILGGKALIEIEEVPNPNGGRPYHHITVTDIWLENVSYFSGMNSKPDGPEDDSPDVSPNGTHDSSAAEPEVSELQSQESDLQTDLVDTRSPHELASSQDELASSPHDLASSPHDLKKNPVKKNPVNENPLNKNPRPPPATNVSTDTDPSSLEGPAQVVVVTPDIEDDQIGQSKKDEANEAMKQYNVSDISRARLLSNYSGEFILGKVDYLKLKLDSGAKIDDTGGWLVKAVQNNYQPPPPRLSAKATNTWYTEEEYQKYFQR